MNNTKAALTIAKAVFFATFISEIVVTALAAVNPAGGGTGDREGRPYGIPVTFHCKKCSPSLLEVLIST